MASTTDQVTTRHVSVGNGGPSLGETVEQFTVRKQQDAGLTYTVEKNGFGFVLVERRAGTPANAERRMPYGLIAEHDSTCTLNGIHDGLVTETPEELRVKQAQVIIDYITERFIQQKPTLLAIETLSQQVEKLSRCFITEVRPNVGMPGTETESGSLVIFGQKDAEHA